MHAGSGLGFKVLGLWGIEFGDSALGRSNKTTCHPGLCEGGVQSLVANQLLHV